MTTHNPFRFAPCPRCCLGPQCGCRRKLPDAIYCIISGAVHIDDCDPEDIGLNDTYTLESDGLTGHECHRYYTGAGPNGVVIQFLLTTIDGQAYWETYVNGVFLDLEGPLTLPVDCDEIDFTKSLSGVPAWCYNTDDATAQFTSNAP